MSTTTPAARFLRPQTIRLDLSFTHEPSAQQIIQLAHDVYYCRACYMPFVWRRCEAQYAFRLTAVAEHHCCARCKTNTNGYRRNACLWRSKPMHGYGVTDQRPPIERFH